MADNESSGSSAWAERLDNHLHVLKDHLNFWNELKKNEPNSSVHHATARQCIDNTQIMIENFQKLQTSFPKLLTTQQQEASNELNHNREQSPTRPEKCAKTRNKPVKDVSDLFTIDPRPTPVEQFQKSKAGQRADKNLKRKITASVLHPIGVSAPLSEMEQHYPKRIKRESLPTPVANQPTPQVADANGNRADDDAFINKVQREHQAQELKRQKKLDKKRKRESGTSTDGHSINVTLPNRSSKRAKRRSDAEAADLPPEGSTKKRRIFMSGEVSVATNQTAPKRKKKHKKT